MTSILQVQRINASDLSIDAFVENYLIPGVPVLISASTRDWAACREWVNSDGSPNVDALASKYGASRVRATRMDFEAAYGEDDIKLMTLSEYVRWWKAREHHDGENPAWYLKDWHFASEYPSAQMYACPRYFEEDWLNGWLDDCAAKARAESSGDSESSAESQDYRFVYLGPRGTHTPMHTDVLKSHSWSTNVAGTKRWTLLPPEAASALLDAQGRNPVRSLWPGGRAPRGRDGNGPAEGAEVGPEADGAPGQSPKSAGPRLAEARRRALLVDQVAGETLFVPGGWWHEVLNAKDALSINHNWIEAAAIGRTWRQLWEESAAAAEAISDCEPLCASRAEFLSLVHRNVRANLGMGWRELGRMLRWRLARRIAADGARGARERRQVSEARRALRALAEAQLREGGGSGFWEEELRLSLQCLREVAPC